MIIALGTISGISLAALIGMVAFRVWQIHTGRVSASDRRARLYPEAYLHAIRHTAFGRAWLKLGHRAARFFYQSKEKARKIIHRDFGFVVRIRDLVRGRGTNTKRGAASLFLKDINDHKNDVRNGVVAPEKKPRRGRRAAPTS